MEVTANGHRLPRSNGRFLRGVRGFGLRLRTPTQGALMSWLYALSGVIALFITIYLVIALLFPEKF
jgi:K+-transporting ATPase KdpF subunit